MLESVRQLWARYRELDQEAPSRPPAVYRFCDNREDADHCAGLVAMGLKRASASSVAELEMEGIPLPRPGDLAVVTDWHGEAKAIVRTTRVDIRAFAEVDADFAREEGEGDLTLGWWRSAHLAYYRRVLEGSGHSVGDDLPIVCERFELVMRA